MWRLVNMEFHDAYTNMAIDEAVGEMIAMGMSPPTVRFYGWRPSAVSIGCFQSMRDEVDLDCCRRNGIQWVRRRTGAGAVYHDTEGEITYSVICPQTLVPGDITVAYREICGRIADALSDLGMEAEFQPINDILVSGRKISGSAQTRRGGVFLQHGTLLYDVNPRTMFSVLKVGQKKISDKLISSFEERVTCVRRESEATKVEVLEALRDSFTRGLEWETGRWSDAEMRRADELISERYSRDEWNLRR